MSFPILSKAKRLSLLVVLAAVLLASAAVCDVAVAPAEFPDARSVREQIDALRAEIARHDELYFRHARPQISDAAYDELKREYEALVAQHSERASSADLASFGDDRTGLFPTQKHDSRMLSLKKAYTEEEVRAFDAMVTRRLRGENPTYVIEPKYDGVAINLVYVKGELVHALTRGNGVEGDEVTGTIVALTGVPATLPAKGEGVPERVELRAEAYVTFAQFQQTNRDREETGEPPFAHPRALAAGIVRLLDAEERMRRELSLVVHGWGRWEPEATKPGSHSDFQERIRAWGFPVAVVSPWASGGDGLWKQILAAGSARVESGFPTDGVVVKVESTRARDLLGEGAGAPQWAVAVKFPSEPVVTRVVGITWQVGRSGVLTPVAELEPVAIGGVMVARATLHSPAHISRIDVRVGDAVEVERAGEVIPRILGVRLGQRAADSQPFEAPQACPSCATSVVRMNEGAILRCENATCPARHLRKLEHFVSPDALDVPGLGPALIETLVAAGSLRTPADLYRITHQDLVRGGAGAGAPRLLRAIETSRGRELWRFIHGLGIPRVGAATARALADEIENLEDLLNVSSVRESEAPTQVSAAVWAAIERHFSEAGNRAVVEALVAAPIRPSRAETTARRSGALRGHTVVFTGTLAGLARQEAIGRVRAAGGTVGSAVNAKTTLVVAGEAAGAKLDEARRRGVRVVGEGEFRKMLSEKNEN